MQFKSTAFFVAGFVAQQAIATGWTDASAYTCPNNTYNHCSSHQQQGYDWSDLSVGSFESYGSNTFSGFTCADSFEKRNVRGVLTKRGFQSKCIKANLDSYPSMSGEAFSINEMQITTSSDADVEAHYGMPDGTTCKEVHSCSTKGTTVQNTQCGGAKSVTFKPGKNAPSGCSIGIHSVGFHCGAPAPSPSPSTSSASADKTSVWPSSVSVPSVYTPYSPTTSSSSTSVAPVTTSPSPSCYGTGCSSTSVSPASSSALSPSCYGNSCSSSPAAPISSGSASPSCYGDQCNASSTSVAPVSSSASPSSTKKSPTSSPTPSTSVSSSPSIYPTPHCPDVLPRCLKTWMFLTTCKDNSDHNCLCPNENFIKNVMSCLSAWSTSDSDVQGAASYLMGICAPHVPQNPAIITACPSGVTPAPAPVASTPAPTHKPTTSGTALPAPSSPMGPAATPPCTTITYSSSALTTTVTVPKVEFTTSTITVSGSKSCSVGLKASTPASAPASTTQTAPYPSGYASGRTKSPSSYGTSWAPNPSSSVVAPVNAGTKSGPAAAGLLFGVAFALAAL